MKVKLFRYGGLQISPLDDAINNFILNKKVIDIKYQMTQGNGLYMFSALIMYED
ncbi:sporulation protein Cse60 [Paucilactobacillus sp. N302-9]